MKKTAILFIMLVCIAGLTACAKEEIYTSEIPDENKTTFELELDKDYSDTDPFVNEILFCVSEDLEDLNAMGTLEMDGERIILEEMCIRDRPRLCHRRRAGCLWQRCC